MNLYKLGIIVVMSLAMAGVARSDSPRPNILMLDLEGTGPHLGCYGYEQAHTPNMDRLAARGYRYENAFATSGVCAPTRSALVTGLYQTTIGTHHMRSDVSLPEQFSFFSKLLKEAGYYCINREGHDWNMSAPPGSWDENSFGKGFPSRLDKNQPFFAKLMASTSNKPKKHNPKKMGALIPPGWPDTSQIRKEWVGYFNDVTAVDHWVGKMLDELETRGLTENTIVIIWSDHGRNAPNVRAKRHVYDAGIHIPLIVHVPEQYRDRLAPPGYTPGGKTDRLVSTIDFAPSVLKLAGVEVPAYMQGRAFIGPDPGEPRKFVYAARDRTDETYDITRAVRTKKFKYIRHYEPWKPYDQHIETKFRVSQAYSELRRLKKKGKLSPEAAHYLREYKPMEELYDLEADPRETENLANDPEYQVTLQKLCAAHRRRMHRTRDLGLVPESLMKRLAEQYGTPYDIFHQSGGLERFMSVREAAITATRGPFARVQMVNLLQRDDPIIRYWAAIGLGNLRSEARPAIPELKNALDDPTASVSIAAARALSRFDSHREKAFRVMASHLSGDREIVRLETANVMAGLGSRASPLLDVMRRQNRPRKSLWRDGGYTQRVLKHLINQLSN